jgi:GNAT superfamily N-acetyltransferase
MFKQHHYLSASIVKSAHCFVAFYGDIPVGFTSTLPSKFGRHVRNIRRGHRTVVLPDYQGIGIGNRMVESVARYYAKQGVVYRGRTAHPSLIRYRLQHPEKWLLVAKPTIISAPGGNRTIHSTSHGRLTATFEWIGGA